LCYRKATVEAAQSVSNCKSAEFSSVRTANEETKSLVQKGARTADPAVARKVEGMRRGTDLKISLDKWGFVVCYTAVSLQKHVEESWTSMLKYVSPIFEGGWGGGLRWRLVSIAYDTLKASGFLVPRGFSHDVASIAPHESVHRQL
jgi:hypothetical protein